MKMCDPQKLAEEQRNMSLLRTTVDFTSAILRQGNLFIPEAIDLIYRPWFERIIKERLEEN
jgi:hypothetical protein